MSKNDMSKNDVSKLREQRWLRRRKVTTLDELAEHWQCSRRTVQRRLANWSAIRSYNQNGRYFTLPDIPRFDRNGLWRYREIFFSKFGNLLQTLIELVRRARAGLTAAEVGELLGLRPSSFLWTFHDHRDLRREKHQGIYVYFSSAPDRYTQQREHRGAMSCVVRQATEAEAIAILVEKIKYPEMSVEELSHRLRRKRLRVDPPMIQDLLIRHGLAGKKGAPDSI